jgi:hypothetical protein
VSDADMTKALHDDAAVPVDGEGKWIDSGRWREVGVVHWHLIEPHHELDGRCRSAFGVAAPRNPVTPRADR